MDTLEIVLRELSDLVDIFFLVESNVTFKGVMTLTTATAYYSDSFQMRKPLVWDLVRETERFRFLSAGQVQQVVISQAGSEEKPEDIWSALSVSWSYFF